MAKRSNSQPSASETPEGTAPVEGQGADGASTAPVEDSTKDVQNDSQKDTEATSPATETSDDVNKSSESEEKSSDDKSDAKDNGATDMSELDPADEKYNPYQDPSIGSSSLADIVVVELKSGKSPTLDSCRKAYKDAKKD